MSTITRIKCKTDNCYLISRSYYKIQALGHRRIYFGHGKPVNQ